MATYQELAQRITGEDEDTCEFLLWNHTAFPFSSIMTTARQLKKWKELKDQGLSECIWCGKGYKSKDGKVVLGGECGTNCVI